MNPHISYTGYTYPLSQKHTFHSSGPNRSTNPSIKIDTCTQRNQSTQHMHTQWSVHYTAPLLLRTCLRLYPTSWFVGVSGDTTQQLAQLSQVPRLQDQNCLCHRDLRRAHPALTDGESSASVSASSVFKFKCAPSVTLVTLAFNTGDAEQ